MNKIALSVIRFYRRFISPYKPACCRFTPTCSHYGLDAYKTHNFLKATYLTAYRILRCNPFNKGGYDPCPHGEKNEK